MARPAADTTNSTALELHGITKRFGSTVVLDDVSFSLQPNSIHALLGENGAGKTTLMRIAFGMIPADTGSIRVNGKDVSLSSPADAIAAGIGMVHQQFSLVPAMSVAENVALGGKGLYRHDEIAKRIADVARRTGLELDPDAKVADLTSAERQKLEIIRTLVHDADILILDEPTAVLTPQDISELFDQLKEFAKQGGAVVLITHKLQDALAHADEVTILRHGRVVLHAPMSSMTVPLLTTAMLGATPLPGSREKAPTSDTEAAAILRGVTFRDRRGVMKGPIDLEIPRGQILGVAALEGAAGAFLRALSGRLRPETGHVEAPGLIGFVPENRQEEALVPDFSLTENVALKDAGKRTGLLEWLQIRDKTTRMVSAFDVHTPGIQTPARNLSGGNQQRFVLARELYDGPPLLVLENPTQGLDINATAAIHSRMRATRDEGTAVVFYSSDLDELAEVADRVLVMGSTHVTFCEPDRNIIGAHLLGSHSEVST